MNIGQAIKRIPVIVWVLLIGVSIIAAIIVFRPHPHPRPARAHVAATVDVVVAQPRTVSVNVIAQGTVTPRRQIDVVSQVSGALVEVSPQFANGGYFAKGATLAQIDPRDYEVAVAKAQAALIEAEKNLATEKGLVRQAKLQWRDLGSSDSNDLFLRKPQLAAAEAQVMAAQAGVKQANINLERTRIALPFAGRISNTWVDLGQFVNMGAKIASVYDASVALVRLPLTDQQAALINLPLGPEWSQTVMPDVTLRGVVAGVAHEWTGKLTRTEASLDAQSRMFYAIVEIADPFNPKQHAVPLLMGMYVEAEITGKPFANVVALPKSVIFRRDKVFSVNADNKLQEKTVTLLRTSDDTVWFTGDIAEGEHLVLDRQGYLTDGASVKSHLVEEKTAALSDAAALSNQAASEAAQ